MKLNKSQIQKYIKRLDSPELKKSAAIELRSIVKDDSQSLLAKEVHRITIALTTRMRHYPQEFSSDKELLTWIQQNILEDFYPLVKDKQPKNLPKWQKRIFGPANGGAIVGISSGSHTGVLATLCNGIPKTIEKVTGSREQQISLLKESAQKYLRQSKINAVITVPAYFNDVERQTAKDMWKNTGFNVLRIINEPTAALLTYNFEQAKEQTFIVIDFGHSSIDISVLCIGDGIFEILSSDHFDIAGQDLGQIVVNWHDKTAEKYKNISQALVIGGRAYVPDLRKVISEVFSCPILYPETPDECIAYGAAIQGAILAGCGWAPDIILENIEATINFSNDLPVEKSVEIPRRKQEKIKDVLLLDVTPLSLGIEIDDKMAVVIRRNTTIPTKKQITIPIKPGKKISLNILQGERRAASHNKIVGNIKLDKLPKKHAQFYAIFDIDANGILKVTITDNNEKVCGSIVVPPTGLSEKQIEEVIDESDIEKQSKTPWFEKYLGESAGNPGPIERLVAQSKTVLKFIQKTFGLCFITVAHILDIVVDMVNSYISKIYQSWKLYKTVQRRIERGTPQKQLEEIKHDFICSRYQLALIFKFNGACKENADKNWLDEISKIETPTFPLELLLDTRQQLDNMKRDLAFVTDQQVLQLAGQNLKGFMTSLIPNPLEFLGKWKDCLVMLFFMCYSRRDIEQMYMDFVESYRNIAYLLSEQCDFEWATSEEIYWQLYSYEEKLLEQVGSSYTPKDLQSLNACLEEAKRNVQRLLQVLFLPQRFIVSGKWSRLDLLREISKMEQIHPVYVLEWERWLTKEIATMWPKDKIDSSERKLRREDARNLKMRLDIEKELSLRCF